MREISDQGCVQIALRISPGLRDRIKAAAKSNGRSVNRELVATLDREYPSDAVEAALTIAVRHLKEIGIPEDEAMQSIKAIFRDDK